MGIFQSIFKRRVSDRAAGSGPRFFFGQSPSGANVNERTALSMTAVYACVRVLAESIASLPLHVYERGENGNQIKAEDFPLYALLHDAPNSEMSSFTFRETLMTHLLLYGNAYAQVLRNGRGEVVALYPLMPNKMLVERDDNGRIQYRYIRYNEEPPTMEGSTVILSPEAVLHIPGMAFDGLVGLSPIAACRSAIGMGISQDEYSSRFYANGAAPMGVLEHPGVIKNPEKLRESWNEAFGGSRNAGKVAILEEGLRFTPISISPADSQLLETRKFSVEEICRIFRVPPHLVQDLSRSTFNNIENQGISFVQYSIVPWTVRWEQALTRSLLNPAERRKYVIRFNIDGLMRGACKDRYDAYAVGINNGFLCPNDVRRLEGFDLIPDDQNGDTFLIQGAMMPLSMAGASYTQTGADPDQASESSDDNPSGSGSDDPEEGSSTDDPSPDSDDSQDTGSHHGNFSRNMRKRTSSGRDSPVNNGAESSVDALKSAASKHTDMVW